MMHLPPPRDFPEGQRQFFGILMALAGVCFGIAAMAAACVIIWGAWPEGLAKLRLYFVGGAMLFASAGSIVVTVALAVGGPVGRLKTKVTREGVETEADAK
jgi:hypothetical protein